MLSDENDPMMLQRRKQRDERRRKRDEERRKRRAENDIFRTSISSFSSGLNHASADSDASSLGSSHKSKCSAGSSSGGGAYGMSRERTAARRKERIERLKEEEKTRNGMELIEKLYPGTLRRETTTFDDDALGANIISKSNGAAIHRGKMTRSTSAIHATSAPAAPTPATGRSSTRISSSKLSQLSQSSIQSSPSSRHPQKSGEYTLKRHNKAISRTGIGKKRNRNKYSRDTDDDNNYDSDHHYNDDDDNDTSRDTNKLKRSPNNSETMLSSRKILFHGGDTNLAVCGIDKTRDSTVKKSDLSSSFSRESRLISSYRVNDTIKCKDSILMEGSPSRTRRILFQSSSPALSTSHSSRKDKSHAKPHSNQKITADVLVGDISTNTIETSNSKQASPLQTDITNHNSEEESTTVRSKTPFLGIKRSLRDYNSSSSDDDLLAISKQLQERKQKQQERQKQVDRLKREKCLGKYDSDSDGEDLLASSRKLSRSRHRSTNSIDVPNSCTKKGKDSHGNTSIVGGSPASVNRRRRLSSIPSSPASPLEQINRNCSFLPHSANRSGNNHWKTKHKDDPLEEYTSDDGNNGDDDKHDLLNVSMQLDIRRRKERKREKIRSRPRNPIEAFKRQEERAYLSFGVSDDSAGDSVRNSSRSKYKADNQIGGDDSNGIDQRDGDTASTAHAAPTAVINTSRDSKRYEDADNVNSLWSDSSEEENVQENCDISKKGLDKKSKKNSNDDGNGEGTTNTKKRTEEKEDDPLLTYKYDRKGHAISYGADNAEVYDSYKYSKDQHEEDENMESQLKPEFTNPKLGPPSALKPLVLRRTNHDSTGDNESQVDHVPASINRYLQEYQREGIIFLHSRITSNKGVILGDDMGLGKTVQVISLLAALQKKSGTGIDLMNIKKRQAAMASEKIKQRHASDIALLKGITKENSSLTQKLNNDRFAPVLVIVPPSVIDNWSNEFKTWGHFAVAIFQDKDRAVSLERIKDGMDDVLICGRSLFTQKGSFSVVKEIPWKLIIIDEFHEYKNGRSQSFECLEELRCICRCPLLGMTGTVMPNKHKELWTLVDLVQPELLGTWKAFNLHVSKPILLSRTKDAKAHVLEIGAKISRELDATLRSVYLKRDKSDVLKDSLTTKDEKVIFCELSNIQKELYKRLMSLPDYQLLRMSTSPCDCGINQKFFLGYKKMRTRKEQIDYQRRHKKELVTRKECCYKIPLNPLRFEQGQPQIDPEAVLWRSFHPSNETCKMCPTCILLPALAKLYKVCSHASLVQLERDPERIEGKREKEEAKRALEFAKVALNANLLEQLPGKSYIREDSIMHNHIALSGKMKTLDYCLTMYERQRDRVLIFSYSTTTLDIIQQYVRGKGFSHLRLDGSTPTKKRQEMIDQYQEDESIFLFLLSTRAGGLGLNLTAANRVIIFDVNWNPSHDEQAQDRAFRIGQKRDVDVVRFVSRGTVEELMYARQVYKVHLKKQTLERNDNNSAPQPARIFRGVDKDPNRKGELFGLENLLKFKDGSFMAEMWRASDSHEGVQSIHQMHSVSNMVNMLSTMTSEQVQCLGDNTTTKAADAVPSSQIHTQTRFGTNKRLPSIDEELDNIDIKGIRHDDFLRDDRGDAALKPGDLGYEEEMGGSSQMLHVTCAIACKKIESEDDDGSTKCGVSKGCDTSINTVMRESPVSIQTPSLKCSNREKDMEKNGEVHYPGKTNLQEIHVTPKIQKRNISSISRSEKVRLMGWAQADKQNTSSSFITSHSLHIPSYLKVRKEIAKSQISKT